MTITYKSQGAGAYTEASGGALSPLCPATVDAGDILILHTHYEGVVTTPSTPAGWTLLYGPCNVGLIPDGRHWVFGRIADGSEDGAAAALGTPAVTTQRGARIYSFAGRVSGTIQELVTCLTNTAHATDPQMPTVRTTKAGALAVALVTQHDNNAIAAAGAVTGGTWAEAVAEFVQSGTPGMNLQIQTATPTGDPGTIQGGAVAATDDASGVIGFQILDEPDNNEVDVQLVATGAWARLAADGTVAIPTTPIAGDRMFLFASWKDFSVTVTDPDGWTPIGTEFTDGSTSASSGLGSVKVMAWYRDWQSGDTDPTIDWSANPTEGHAVITVWRKTSSMTWDTPLNATGAMTSWTTSSQVSEASSTVDITASSVVMGLVGIRDDSAVMTRPSTGIDDAGALITWEGDYQEAPYLHFNSATGLDMSGDLGHRFVSVGATGVTLRQTGTISAAETGAMKWVVQGVSADSDPSLAVDGGTYAITGTAAGLRRTGKITSVSGSYAISGTAASLEKGYKLIAGAGSYAISGQTVGLRSTRLISAVAGSYEITGTAAGLARGRTISAEGGTYAIDGQAIGLRTTRLISIAGGSYEITGSDAGLFKGRTISVDPGSYSLSGTAAALRRTAKIVPVSGSYEISGTDASLKRVVILTALGGTYAVTGQTAALLADRLLAAGAASYVIEGTDASLFKGRTLVVDAGSYAITGDDLDFSYNRIFRADSGIYSIVGADAELVSSGAQAAVSSGAARKEDLAYLRQRWKIVYDDDDEFILLSD